MSWVKNKFFGGAEKRAAKKRVESTQEAQKLLSANIDRARGEVRPLFEQAQADITGGFDRARDILQPLAGQQAQAFQTGNLQAQNTLLAGLPQIQNAILGNAPVDLSGLQPSSVPLQGGLLPPAQQQANAGVLNTLGGGQFQGPLQGTPQAQGTIADQIANGTLTFAQMTQEQREQFARERQTRQDNNFGIGGEGR